MMHMRKLVALALLSAFLVLPGCGLASLKDLDARDAKLTNNIGALTLEASITTLELLYEIEQRAMIEAALKEPDITKTEIRERLAKLRGGWAPVWKVVDGAREVQAKLAAALEQGDPLATTGAAVDYAAKAAELGALIKATRERVTKQKEGVE